MARSREGFTCLKSQLSRYLTVECLAPRLAPLMLCLAAGLAIQWAEKVPTDKPFVPCPKPCCPAKGRNSRKAHACGYTGKCELLVLTERIFQTKKGKVFPPLLGEDWWKGICPTSFRWRIPRACSSVYPTRSTSLEGWQMVYFAVTASTLGKALLTLVRET